MRNKKTINHREIYARIGKYAILALILIIFSLFIGTVGYHYFGNICWIDSFYYASMILTGMGPVDKLPGPEAKIFASLYALFSGTVFLSSVAILFSPIAHILMRKLHLDENDS